MMVCGAVISGCATGPHRDWHLLDRFLEIYPDDSSALIISIANLEVLELDGDRAKTRSTFCYITRDPSDAPCVHAGRLIILIRLGAVRLAIRAPTGLC